MAKSDPDIQKQQKKQQTRWVITIFLVTIAVSAVITLASDELMAGSGTFVAFLVLLAIIMVGIIFDIIGVAVTSADEKPFHAMAARKVPGARDAIFLLRKAEKVSSICCDVVGDICGVVSGSASATIAARVLANFDFSWPQVITLAMSSLVAGLTVGGKAIGKTVAMNSCVPIVHTVGKILATCKSLPQRLPFRKNQK